MSKKPHALYCDDVSRTKQAPANDLDINEIIRRAKNGMDISKSINARTPRYGDFTCVSDFKTMCDTVNNAKAAFMQLDAKLRKRFDNDPAKMFDFLADETNREEAEKLGLISSKSKTVDASKNPVEPAVKPADSKDTPK